MNKEYHETLKLANKIYRNSYECMWNDAMLYSLKNNCFYFYDSNIIRKTRKFGQKSIKKLMKKKF